MLSPLDLQNKKIVTKKRKYDKQEMDEYLELVFENYKELFNQNQELEKKVKTLSDGVQYYRSIETTLQKALVLAEKTAKETKDAAVLKAEAIEKEANTKASKITTEAEQNYEKTKDKCISLVQQFNQYKMQLKQVATAQLELVTSEAFDVYSPELDAIQYAKNSLPPVEQEEIIDSPISEKTIEENNGIIEKAVDDVLHVQAKNEEEIDELDFIPDDEKESDFDKTMIIPDIHTEKINEPISEDDTISILTADTIDLSDSLQQLQQEHMVDAPHEAKPKSVQTASVKTPVDAQPLSPMDVKLEEVKAKKPEVLEPVESDSGKEAPTLDSLLQSINVGKSKKKNKKGQDEDPFEFLGSVDDF